MLWFRQKLWSYATNQFTRGSNKHHAFDHVRNNDQSFWYRLLCKYHRNFYFSCHLLKPIMGYRFAAPIGKKNEDKFHGNHVKAEQYTSKCVCPCSNRFKNWYKKYHICMLPGFRECASSTFDDYTVFVEHLYNNHGDYYHRIILRVVQCSYSSLISKIKISPASVANN